MRGALPDSLHLIWDDSVLIEDVLVFGARLWTVPGLAFPDVPGDPEQDEKILHRELRRLEKSIAAVGERGRCLPEDLHDAFSFDGLFENSDQCDRVSLSVPDRPMRLWPCALLFGRREWGRSR